MLARTYEDSVVLHAELRVPLVCCEIHLRLDRVHVALLDAFQVRLLLLHPANLPVV